MDPDLRQRSLHTQGRSSLQSRQPPRTQTSGSSLPPSPSCSPFCLTSCPDLTRQPSSRLHLSIPRSGGLRSQATPKLASFWGRGSSGTRPGVGERAEGSSSLRLPPPGDRGRGTLALGNSKRRTPESRFRPVLPLASPSFSLRSRSLRPSPRPFLHFHSLCARVSSPPPPPPPRPSPSLSAT